MRSKTETKRLAILRAAAEVFRAVGFERASMSDICARVGGSKATLYNYFPSKEKLFFEVMFQAKDVELEAIAAALNPDASDLKQELVRFGQQFLRFAYEPQSIAIRRLSIAQASQAGIGKMSYELTSVPTEKHVAGFLKKAMQRGALRAADPKVAAMQLLSLFESEWLQRILYGVVTSVKPQAIRASVRRAVDAFLAGYAVPAMPKASVA